MDEGIEPTPEAEGSDGKGLVKGAVSFVDIGFAYPSRPDVTVFR